VKIQTKPKTKSSYLLYLITMNIKAKNMPPMYDIIASINSHWLHTHTHTHTHNKIYQYVLLLVNYEHGFSQASFDFQSHVMLIRFLLATKFLLPKFSVLIYAHRFFSYWWQFSVGITIATSKCHSITCSLLPWKSSYGGKNVGIVVM
jgi:hypothetical protein